MAWTNPKTWVTEYLTAAKLNTHLRDNLNWLADRIGVSYLGTVYNGAGYTVIAGTTTGTTNGSGDLAITFGTTFAHPPRVVVCLGEAETIAGVMALESTLTKTGVTVRCLVTSTAVRVNWIAVGQLEL